MLGLTPAILIARVFVLLIAFTVHEFAHAWTADYFGDNTPRAHGRLTLNPMAHLDFLGSLMLVIAGFGWAKPVPVNPYALRRRSESAFMLVALAGPASNLLLAIIGAIPFQFGLVSVSGTIGTFFPSPAMFLNEFIVINLLLLFFNLIPLYPLDGEKIAMYFFPPAWQSTMERIRPYSPMILLALVFLAPRLGINLLSWIIGPPMRWLYSILVL